jgi:hypothetical protein
VELFGIFAISTGAFAAMAATPLIAAMPIIIFIGRLNPSFDLSFHA